MVTAPHTDWHSNGSEAAASRARVWQLVATASRTSRTATRSHSFGKKRQPPAVWPGSGGAAYVLDFTRNDRGPSGATDCGARPFCPRPRLLIEMRDAGRFTQSRGSSTFPSCRLPYQSPRRATIVVQILTSAHSSIRDMEVITNRARRRWMLLLYLWPIATHSS
jgi:hypothetical protein